MAATQEHVHPDYFPLDDPLTHIVSNVAISKIAARPGQFPVNDYPPHSQCISLRDTGAFNHELNDLRAELCRLCSTFEKADLSSEESTYAYAEENNVALAEILKSKDVLVYGSDAVPTLGGLTAKVALGLSH